MTLWAECSSDGSWLKAFLLLANLTVRMKLQKKEQCSSTHDSWLTLTNTLQQINMNNKTTFNSTLFHWQNKTCIIENEKSPLNFEIRPLLLVTINKKRRRRKKKSVNMFALLMLITGHCSCIREVHYWHREKRQEESQDEWQRHTESRGEERSMGQHPNFATLMPHTFVVGLVGSHTIVIFYFHCLGKWKDTMLNSFTWNI